MTFEDATQFMIDFCPENLAESTRTAMLAPLRICLQREHTKFTKENYFRFVITKEVKPVEIGKVSSDVLVRSLIDWRPYQNSITKKSWN